MKRTCFRLLLPVALLLLPAVIGRAAPPRANVARSAEHPMTAARYPMTAVGSRVSFVLPRRALPLSLACRSDDGWSLYSREVNVVNAFAGAKNGDVWLGTGLGLKRLNARRRRVRHFTRADGLPGDVVYAVAADAREAWCLIAASGPGPRTVFACRWTEEAGRWTTERAWTLPPPTWNDGPTPPFYISQSPAAVAFVVGSASAQTENAVAVWDRARGRWKEDLKWPAASPDRAARPWRDIATFQHADASGGVWLGTGEGLLHHPPGDPPAAWQRWWPDHAIASGVASASGDVLWLAGLRRVSGTTNQLLRLLRLSPKAGGPNAATFPAPDDGLRGQNWRGSIRLTLDAAGGVWLVSGMGGRRSATPSFHRFDPRTGGWRLGVGREVDARGNPLSEIARADLERLPDVVLRLLVVTCAPGVLPADLMARRLPGWACPEADDLPDEARPDAKPAPPAWREPGTDGALWTVASDGGALVRRPKNGSAERVALPDAPVALTPPISDMALAGGDALFVRLANNRLRRYHVPTGVWSGPIALPERSRLESHSNDTLAGNAQSLWIRHGDAVLRYDGAAGRLVTAFDGQGERRLRDADGLLVRFLPRQSFGPGLAGVTPFSPLPAPDTVPEGLHVGNAYPEPTAAAGGLFWYHGETYDPNDPAGETTLAAFDPQTRTWRAPLRFRFRATRFSLLAAPGGSGMFALPSLWNGPAPTESENGVYRYDAGADKWSLVAAPPPNPFDDNPQLALVSVDDERIWVASRNRLRLWEYDRRAARWQVHDSPDAGRGGYGGTTTVRVAGAIFLAAAKGLWRFDVASGAWRRVPLPGTARRDLKITQIAGDANAVWALCVTRTDFGQSFVVRLDRKTRAGKLWDETSGFPERYAPLRLFSDGVTAWVAAGGYDAGASGAYRLDEATSRWTHPTNTLAPAPGTFVHVEDSAANAHGIYLLVSTAWISPEKWSGPPPPRIPALMHFAPSAAAAPPERFEPPGGAGRLLLAEPDALYLAGASSLHRLDARTRTWRTLRVPAGFPAPAWFAWDRLLRARDGRLCLTKRDAVLCYRRPVAVRAPVIKSR